MILRKLEVVGKFRWLWLKTVKRVLLHHHCAQCLGGSYVEAIREVKDKEGDRIVENLPLEDCVYYLCGVATPPRWENNFHLAFRPKKGGTVEVDKLGLRVLIEDAEELPIDSSCVDPNDPNIGDPHFSTCRNWQFANYFAKRLATDPSQVVRKSAAKKSDEAE